MENIKILILSIVQGVSELLPISSSGHLIVLGHIMEIPVSNLLLTTLHLGTSFALILFFRKKLFKNLFTKEKLLFYLKILVATIPVGVVGILFENKISQVLRYDWIIAMSLILWGINMIVIDNIQIKVKYKSISEIPFWKALLIGASQIVALIPGTSRSAVSIITGILLGVKKYTSLEYTFIIGIPVLLGSAIWEIMRAIPDSSFIFPSFIKVAIVCIVPFIVGYLCLLILQRIKKSRWLTIFGIYRIVIGLIFLFL